MRKGLAVTLRAAVLALVSNLALAGPLPMSLPAMPAAPRSSAAGALGGTGQSGIRPAVLEIAIPNSVHRALARPAGEELSAPAAKAVQWLTGPVPSRCQHGASATLATPPIHACLVM
jgi:hypothetical protein